MTRLGVNIDHVATIREARKALEPDPVAAAILAEQAGAHGITVHLRGDRRHISDRDVRLLQSVIKTRLNVEMAVTEEMLAIACDLKPDSVTLVPESPDEITTQGGLDVVKHRQEITRGVSRLRDAGIEVSLFVDPEPEQIEASESVGVTMVELNTAAYSEAVPRGVKNWDPSFEDELEKIIVASEEASAMALRVLAGHGLTYRNVGAIAAVPAIEELNIGHNVIARAVMVGMERAVKDMLRAMLDDIMEE
jgi:pyridoxine 5-phosphate synthase